MGQRGPVPKRTAEQAGHRAKADAATSVVVRGRVRRPPMRQRWSEETREWYDAIGRSGEARWYEPSDWQMALVAGDMYERLLDNPNATLYAAFLKACEELNLTESARRRSRIEVDRPDVAEDEADAAGEAALIDLALVRSGEDSG